MFPFQVMQESCVSLEKNLEKRHTYVTQPDTLSLADTIQPGKPVKIEGYLFKRGSSAFRTWNRRWFYLDNNKLCYAKRSGDEVTVMEDDLRICLVRPITDIDRRLENPTYLPKFTKNVCTLGSVSKFSRQQRATSYRLIRKICTM